MSQVGLIVTSGLVMPKIKRPHKPKPAPYPFKDMKVGDSFFLPLNGKARSTVRPNLFLWAKKCKIVIATRTEYGPNGFRVWRIQ